MLFFWLRFLVAQLVVGVSGTIYRRYSTRQAAEEAYERGLAAGAVAAI